MKEYKLSWKLDKWIETKSEESMVQNKMDQVHILLDDHEFNDPQSVTFKSFLEDYLNALTIEKQALHDINKSIESFYKGEDLDEE